MAVITVFNQKGGVGKTTSTLNLAFALALLKKNPCALDLDPQGHLTLACGVKGVSGEDSVFSFFSQDKPLDQLVRTLPAGLSLIPASLDLSKIDALYAGNPSITTKLREGLRDKLRQNGVPILIDCCPMLGVLTLNALIAADRVLIPVAADFLSLQGVQRLDTALNVLETKLKRKFERRVIVTRFDSRRRLSFEIYDILKKHFGGQLCEARISENVSLAASPMHGKSIFAFAPHSPGAKDYRALTEELWNSGFLG
ncbi:MAG: ParA family protein [Pseudomonadota bacterium]